jgi:hypothetical protein
MPVSDPADGENPIPLLQTLRSATAPLYALVDAARSPAILPILDASAAPRACLFEGENAEALSAYGAYVLRLGPREPLCETLVQQGWGHSWGVYLTSVRPFDELLAHLRQRIWVRDPNGARLYFRFFDPRVMRTALPAMGPVELSAFFGPVESFIVEGETPQRLYWWQTEGEAVRLYRTAVRI